MVECVKVNFITSCFCLVKITMTTFFNSVELSPPVEVFALVAAYNEDNHAQKVNLGVGGRCTALRHSE